MDHPGTPSGQSPRRVLQGPRPTPLKVHKDSHKIRKPPVAPPPATGAPPHPSHAPPVIIYAVSPKIIHANPNEFMSLVQRLTGPNSTYANSPSTSSPAHAFNNGGAISPAACYAAIEKTKSPDGRRAQFFGQNMEIVNDLEIGSTDHNVQRTGNFPGILSPNPHSLPPIPPSFFSQPSLDNYNNNPLSFFQDMSPVLHSSRNYFENNNFMFSSPSNNFSSPHIYVPSPNTVDLFNTLFDI